MRKLLSVAAFLAFVAVLPAQTLTLKAGTAEVAGTAKNHIYRLDELYFIYNATTGGFEAKQVETRATVYAANVSTVTISGLSTAASKISWIENTHVRATTTSGYTVLVPKNGLAVRYRSSDKKTDLMGRYSMNQGALWYGHADSIKTATNDTTTALRLTALRQIVQGATPQLIGNNANAATIAAGAAAGTSPTVAVTGNELSGEITITTGGSTTTTGVIATITLPKAFPNGCRVNLTPSSAAAALESIDVFATTTSSTIVLNASGNALTASTANFKYFYTVTGY